MLVVCPSALQVQWRDEMRDKFGLEFRIVDSALQKTLRRTRGLHANPWTQYPRLITSIDFLKRERPLRLMREALPAEGQPAYPRTFDLLVVDEAHNVAPSGAERYPIASDRTNAIRTIAPPFRAQDLPERHTAQRPHRELYGTAPAAGRPAFRARCGARRAINSRR
jgi:hypothetical protein